MALRIPEETIDRIKSNTNIVDVVSQYVQLKKRGKNYFGYCPFHDERTPSFSVTEEKQIFHCFSCGKGGNVFTFLMEIDGVPFAEAVKKTAELGNMEDVDIQLPQENASPAQGKKDELKKAHEEAAAFYHQILMNTLIGEAALAYLYNRGFTEETLQEFQIGYSPPDRTATHQMLKARGFSEQILQETGIFSDRTDGQLLDRFSSRITFPLRDEKGRVIAFSGRILPAVKSEADGEEEEKPFHEAKYLNSPEGILFSKRDFLFNFDKARRNMRSSSEAVLFEGYMDVISAWQAGVHNGVASMGTSLTEEQVRILRKVVSSLVIAFDGDRAGMEASKKAIDFLEQEKSFDLAVFPLAAGMDPDEFIQEKGAEVFVSALQSRRETTFQFQARYLKGKLNLDSEKNRVLFLEEMVKRLLQVESLLEREMYLKELAEEFDLEIDVLKRQLQDYQKDYLKVEQKKRLEKTTIVPYELPERVIKEKVTQVSFSQRQLLYRLFHYEEAWLYLQEAAPQFSFLREDYQTIFLLYGAYREEKGSVGNVDSFISRLSEDQLAATVVEIELLNLNSPLTREEIFDLVHIVTSKAALESKIKEKQREMKEASRQHNHDEARKLLLEIVSLSKELKTVKK